MLRRRGIRATSINEHADDSPTGRLMEVRRGMRESGSRGVLMAPVAPFAYRRMKVQDGAKERPKLEVDESAARAAARRLGSTPNGSRP